MRRSRRGGGTVISWVMSPENRQWGAEGLGNRTLPSFHPGQARLRQTDSLPVSARDSRDVHVCTCMWYGLVYGVSWLKTAGRNEQGPWDMPLDSAGRGKGPPRTCPQVGTSRPREVSRVLGCVQPRDKEDSLEKQSPSWPNGWGAFGWAQVGVTPGQHGPSSRMAPDPRTSGLALHCPVGDAVVLRCSPGFLAGLALVWEPVLAGENRQSGPLASARPRLGAGGRERQQGTPKLWWSPCFIQLWWPHQEKREEHPSAYQRLRGQHGLPGSPRCLCPWRDLCQAGQVGGTDAPGAGWEGGQGGVQSGGRVCGTPRGSVTPPALQMGYLDWRCPLGMGLLVGQSAAPRVPSSWWGAWATRSGLGTGPGASSPSGTGWGVPHLRGHVQGRGRHSSPELMLRSGEK